MKNILFLSLILCFAISCRKEKIDNTKGNCNSPIALSSIKQENFKGQFLYVDSFWTEGKNVHVHTYGSCVSEPKNTALLWEEDMLSSYHSTYNLYLADTANNDFTIDCFATKPMTLCFNLDAFLPKTDSTKFKIRTSPKDTTVPKIFFLKR